MGAIIVELALGCTLVGSTYKSVGETTLAREATEGNSNY